MSSEGLRLQQNYSADVLALCFSSFACLLQYLRFITILCAHMLARLIVKCELFSK